MQISIDENSGFCWGVVRTVDIAEKSLEEVNNDNIFVLGQIIHNPKEIERLENKGLKSITRDDFERLANTDANVIIRAHGEPPETYKLAQDLGINIIDATCPLVTKLQQRIKEKYDEGWQIVIFGKKEHAEVVGLRGVCNDDVIVIKSIEEALNNVNFDRKTILFSQTTMDKQMFNDVRDALRNKVENFIDGGDIKDTFLTKNTLCHHVFGREDKLKMFCRENNVVLFVAGRNSSNGKSLYNICKTVNDNVYFIEDYKEINPEWFEGVETVGITGATSTPQWYMETVRDQILEMTVLV